MDIDKIVGNDVLRKITTEPKALIIYWLLQQHDYYSLGQIRDGISEEFGLDLDSFRCFDSDHIDGYFRESLCSITTRPKKIRNTKPGRRFVKGLRLTIAGKPHLAHLREIAGHELYASATLTERLGEITALNQIFYGNPWEEGSDTGAPIHVALILSAVSKYTQLYVRDLSRLIGFDEEQTLLHLKKLDSKDYLRLLDEGEVIYILNRGVDSDVIMDRNRRFLGIEESSNVLTVNRCTCEVLNFLKQTPYGASLEGIHDNIKKRWKSGKVEPYSMEYTGKVLSRMADLGIVQETGRRVQPTYKTLALAEIPIDPVLAAISGDISLLKTPTNEQIYKAISDYQSSRNKV